MPLYEHVFISRQDLSSAQAESLIEHFTAVVTDNGGKVVENEYWGVKTMAYKITRVRASFERDRIQACAGSTA